MNTTQKRTIPWYLWPFWAIWRLVVIIIGSDRPPGGRNSGLGTSHRRDRPELNRNRCFRRHSTRTAGHPVNGALDLLSKSFH